MKTKLNLYCGIDLSFTGTGIVIIDSENKILNKILISTKPAESTEDRILKIYDTFRNFKTETISTYKASILSDKTKKIKKSIKIYYGIEGIAFGSRGQRAYQQGALHYYFRIRLTKRPTTIVPPSQLKKSTTGNGRASKSLMLLHIFKRFGEEFDDDNLGDAYALSRYIKDPKNVIEST